MKAVLLIVPQAKAQILDAARWDALIEALGGGGVVRAETPTSPAEIPARIRALADEVEAVAVGGGDGTLRAAAEALVETGLPLLIIPLGTANDLARTLALPLDPVAAVEAGRSGRRTRVDVGTVNGCCFFNVAGIGLSADVARRLARGPKRFGPLSYLFAAAAIFRRRRAFRARIAVDGTQIALRSIQISVANGRRHGGAVMLEPEADIQDGCFDIYSLAPQPWWRIFALIPALRRGTHYHWKGMTLMRGETVRVETRQRPKRVNADGELVTETPAEVRMHRGAVRVMRP